MSLKKKKANPNSIYSLELAPVKSRIQVQLIGLTHNQFNFEE